MLKYRLELLRARARYGFLLMLKAIGFTHMSQVLLFLSGAFFALAGLSLVHMVW